MKKDTTAIDFKDFTQEISNALNILNLNGFETNISDKLKKEINLITLFDGDDLLFKELIKDAKVYFEYGAGKSTEFVYQYTNANIYTVDTSEEWANKVKHSINDNQRLSIDWIDVGKVGNWGVPVSFKNRHNFKSYAELFWLKDVSPDLVLIDGRFRVLCFLNCMKYAPIGTKILFDDYTNRPFYHVVEEISPVLQTCGRQALFEVTTKSKNMVDDNWLLTFQNVIG